MIQCLINQISDMNLSLVIITWHMFMIHLYSFEILVYTTFSIRYLNKLSTFQSKISNSN
jgi:hypothetical protein